MNYVRATVRALAFCVVTGLLYVLWLVGSVVVSLSGKMALRWRSFVFQIWAQTVALILGMKINVFGVPPQTPFFLVSNHLSYVDIIVFASLLDCVFIAKQDVASWPVIGFLCRKLNTIFIDRHSRRDVARVNAVIQQILAEGRSVILFAEGTSTQGASVLPFKASLLEPAAKANYPVSYAAVSYRTPANQPPAHVSVCWWGDMTFLSHLFTLFQIQRFEATVIFSSQTIRETDRRVLASRLRQAVAEQLAIVKKHAEDVPFMS